MTDAALQEVGRQRYVSLTTFRRSGIRVSTPVWVAVDGTTLVITTTAATGKVKRLRNNPRIELRPCSRTGAVAPGTTAVLGVATIEPFGPPTGSAVASLAEKYGWQWRIAMLAGSFGMRISSARRTPAPDRLILRVTTG